MKDRINHQQLRHFAAHLQGKNREPALQKSCKPTLQLAVVFQFGFSAKHQQQTNINNLCPPTNQLICVN
jgi:hypothetical protein